MKSFSKVVVRLLLVALFLASGVAWCRTPIRDGDPGTIGACLAQPDGSRVLLPCEEVTRCGRSGKSFAIKEWFEPQPEKPRLAVVSTRPLPVKEYWNVDVTGVLSTFSGVSRDGTEIRQRVLIVSPENVTVYCSPNGRPVPFTPIKGIEMDWPNKRSLADLTRESVVETASVSVMSEGDLPPMPDGLDSESPPIYCATIAEARTAYDPNNRVLVELQCRPFSGATSTQFTLGQDSPADSITTYYTNSGGLGTGRINKIVGTIQKDAGTNYWIEVDSGPNWQSQDPVGSVQTAPEGSIAWAKTFADGASLPADLSNKVVSRAFPGLGYFYIQEPTREAGIRVNDVATASFVIPGDTVSIPASTAQVNSLDGERVIDSPQTVVGEPTAAPKPIGINNRDLGGGVFNTFTPGPDGGAGLSNVGLLVRAWGKVTSVGADYFYLDDGSGKADGSGAIGVRVANLTGYLPSVNDYVAVTGISGLAIYATDYARTIRFAQSNDLSGVCPPLPAANLSATSTGSGKITVYWDGVVGATGYNIYRGTTSGGENYLSPVNGATPWTTPSYPGGNVYAFTDTGLMNGTEYFYTVKAVAGCGESQPSNEGNAIPESGGIPWDTGDPNVILPAIRNAFPAVVIPTGTLRSCGPDGRIYQEGVGTALPPDAVIDSLTRDVTFPDGTIITLPADEAEGSGMAILSATFPNAQSGPFRKVRTRSSASYRGAKGRFRVPDSSIAIRRTPYTYPNGKSTKDIPYLYLGGLGNGHEIDAGIYYGATNQDPNDRWRMFMKIDKRWVNTPPNGVFDDNQDLNVLFTVSPNVSNEVLLQVSPVGGTTGTLTQHAPGFPKTANGVRIKRVHSIAQNSLRGADLQRGYRMTGSYFQTSEWHDGYVQNQAGGFDWWGTSQTTSSDEGSFPSKGPIVDWYLVNFLSQTKRYADEINVNIHL